MNVGQSIRRVIRLIAEFDNLICEMKMKSLYATNLTITRYLFIQRQRMHKDGGRHCIGYCGYRVGKHIS